MSNTLSIAAVTATIRNLLLAAINSPIDPALAGAKVVTTPPDKAADADSGGTHLNVFLYHVVASPAWRNQTMPGQLKSGESGSPPLGLNLYYLISAYVQGNDDMLAHRLLGLALSTLHDHPVLGRTEIQTALADNDLHAQIERVRITLQPLSIEDMYKLWSAFQTSYRISAAYEVAVTLIDSKAPAKAALPVLSIGSAPGSLAQTGLVLPVPTLEAVTLPNQQDAALLGDTLVLTGHDLQGTAPSFVRFKHRLWQIDVLASGSPTQLTVVIPNVPAQWLAGFYQVSVVVKDINQAPKVTEALTIALAPKVISVAPDPTAAGAVTQTFTFEPEVHPLQRASLLILGQEILAPPHPAQTGNLTFTIANAPAGKHFYRLRIDGVDSLLIDHTVVPPQFDLSQRVEYL